MTGATTIVNARVFDVVAPREWTSVRFAEGVIVECAVDSLAREGDIVVDAAGGTLIPGLIDAHVHLVPGALELSLNSGVTTALDMFSLPEVVAGARERASSSRDHADLRSAGVGATAPGGHPSLVYGDFPTLTAPDEAEAFVAARVAEGSDYLKVFSGVGGIWPALDPRTIAALVRAAHDRGLLVVAHVSSVAGVDEVVAAGVDVIAHVPADGSLDPSLIDRIAAAGIAVGPTLATLESLAAKATDTFRRGPSYEVAAANVRQLAEAGVVLLAGTDAPNPGALFGQGLHRELELLVAVGLTPAAAMRAATSAPARVFGLGDRGRIGEGLRADLLLVRGDPLVDISAIRSVERVWRGGVAVAGRPFVPTRAERMRLAAFDRQVAEAVAAVRERRSRFSARAPLGRGRPDEG